METKANRLCKASGAAAGILNTIRVSTEIDRLRSKIEILKFLIFIYSVLFLILGATGAIVLIVVINKFNLWGG